MMQRRLPRQVAVLQVDNLLSIGSDLGYTCRLAVSTFISHIYSSVPEYLFGASEHRCRRRCGHVHPPTGMTFIYSFIFDLRLIISSYKLQIGTRDEQGG